MASGSQRSIARATEIGRVATRHGFGYLFDRRRATNGATDGDRGRRLREMLDELGPTFVKFGQLLSTRPDVVPPDIIVELQKLQDDVTPFPMEDVERVVTEELGIDIAARVRLVRPAADRGRVDRPGAPGDAAERGGRRRQGAASLGASADRLGPEVDGLRRQARPRACPAARLRRHRRARRRVRPLDPPGARLPAGGAERRDVPPELRRERAASRSRACGGGTRRRGS